MSNTKNYGIALGYDFNLKFGQNVLLNLKSWNNVLNLFF